MTIARFDARLSRIAQAIFWHHDKPAGFQSDRETVGKAECKTYGQRPFPCVGYSSRTTKIRVVHELDRRFLDAFVQGFGGIGVFVGEIKHHVPQVVAGFG